MIFKLYAAAFMITTLTGCCSTCLPPSKAIIYNNSAETISAVSNHGRTLQIQPGEEKEIEVVELLSVKIGTNSQFYGAMFMEKSGIIIGRDFTHGNDPNYSQGEYGQNVRLQYENDGRLFIAKNDEVFPITIVGQQPKGYPLVPLDFDAERKRLSNKPLDRK